MGWGEAEKLLDSVGLIEDHGGANLHDNCIGTRLHGVVAQFHFFAID